VLESSQKTILTFSELLKRGHVGNHSRRLEAGDNKKKSAWGK